jgi:hypothetical protein
VVPDISAEIVQAPDFVLSFERRCQVSQTLLDCETLSLDERILALPIPQRLQSRLSFAGLHQKSVAAGS